MNFLDLFFWWLPPRKPETPEPREGDRLFRRGDWFRYDGDQWKPTVSPR